MAYLYFDPKSAPLRDVPRPMLQRAMHELNAHLSEDGIELMGGDGEEGYIIVNLRNLALRSGSIELGKQAFYRALVNLNVVRVDLQVQDVAYLLSNNPISFAIQRGLESHVQGLVNLLAHIAPDQLFENLDKAIEFVYADRNPDEAVNARLRVGAEMDLRNNGLLDGNGDYTSWMDAPPEREPQAHAEFETSPKPWRSPFDRDEIGGF